MASLNDICKGIIDDVDEALASAVVDLESGLILGVSHNVPYFTQTYLDAVAASAVDMFRGKSIRNTEKLIANMRGEEPSPMIKEIQFVTEKTYHFMTVVPGKPNAMAVLITTKQANMGMGWASLRNNLSEIAPHCP